MRMHKESDGTLRPYTAEEEAKADASLARDLVSRVNQIRDERMLGGFEWNGNRFQTDPRSRLNITQLALAATEFKIAGGLPIAKDWVETGVDFDYPTVDNVRVKFTAQQFIDFARASGVYERKLYVAASLIKASLRAGQVVDVESDPRWP